MKKTMRLFGALAVVSGLAMPASADTIVWGGSGGWTTHWVPNEDGVEYWDQTSHDGANCNIGFYLTGTLGTCGNQSGPSAPEMVVDPLTHGYLNDGGNAISDIWIESSGDMLAGLVLEIAGLRDGNVFGYYNRLNPDERVVLFDGLSSPPATVAFNPYATHGWGEYGFFLISDTNTYFSESSRNSLTEAGLQHFAFFEGPDGRYFMGVEDVPFWSADRDYNDMLIRFNRGGAARSVPEPTTTALFGLGLLAAAAIVRRRIVG